MLFTKPICLLYLSGSGGCACRDLEFEGLTVVVRKYGLDSTGSAMVVLLPKSVRVLLSLPAQKLLSFGLGPLQPCISFRFTRVRQH